MSHPKFPGRERLITAMPTTHERTSPAVHHFTVTEWLLIAVIVVDIFCVLYAVLAAISDLPHVPDSLAPYLAGLLLPVTTMALIAKRMRAQADQQLTQVGNDVIEVRELHEQLLERLAAVERRQATLIAYARQDVLRPNVNGRVHASVPTSGVYVSRAATPGPSTVELPPPPKRDPLAGYLDDAAPLVELGRELERDRSERDDP